MATSKITLGEPKVGKTHGIQIRVIYYNDRREETDCVVLNPESGSYGVHIPKNQWHTLEVIESGSVIFEVKEGPYIPLGEEDILL